ncbi:MAG: hypothetical protein U0521_22285 [Anaerolineae bacterium]
MPRLVILSPVVWTFRNIVYSGILSRLSEAGVEVHLLARDVSPDILSALSDLASTATLERLIEPSHNANVRGITFCARSSTRHTSGATASTAIRCSLLVRAVVPPVDPRVRDWSTR